jgi:hypothetical protein
MKIELSVVAQVDDDDVQVQYLLNGHHLSLRIAGGMSMNADRILDVLAHHHSTRSFKATERATLEDAIRAHDAGHAALGSENPPVIAEFLFSWLAPKRVLQAQLGDLREIFELNVARFGKSRAGMLYWTQVLRAVGPGIWRRIKKLGFIGILVDYGRSKLGF